MNVFQTGGKATILVVDDNPADRKFMSIVLMDGGYNVLEAKSGEEGLRIFKDHQDEIDLVITDMVMPGINGVELARRVRKLSARPKVIFISGHKAQCGPDGQEPEVLEKSDDMFQLLQKTHEVLESRCMILSVLELVPMGGG